MTNNEYSTGIKQHEKIGNQLDFCHVTSYTTRYSSKLVKSTPIHPLQPPQSHLRLRHITSDFASEGRKFRRRKKLISVSGGSGTIGMCRIEGERNTVQVQWGGEVFVVT